MEPGQEQSTLFLSGFFLELVVFTAMGTLNLTVMSWKDIFEIFMAIGFRFFNTKL